MKLCTTDKVKLTQTHVAVWYVGLRYNWMPLFYDIGVHLWKLY